MQSGKIALADAGTNGLSRGQGCASDYIPNAFCSLVTTCSFPVIAPVTERISRARDREDARMYGRGAICHAHLNFRPRCRRFGGAVANAAERYGIHPILLNAVFDEAF